MPIEERQTESAAERLYVFGGTALAVVGMFKRSTTGGLGLLLLGGALVAKGLQERVRVGEEHSEPIAVKPKAKDEGGVKVEKSIVIHASPEKIYTFWKNLENLPRVFSHLVSVRDAGEGCSLWTAKAPMDATVTWEAETVEDIPNQLIAWESIKGSSLENKGSVRFRAVGESTQVTVDLEYKPPLGVVGVTAAKILGEEPNGQLEEDLERLRVFMEEGSVPPVQAKS